ncbi:MAG: ABC transporter substrate-binding protein [Hyphomicrobiaceae bacterium]|nr:ABC transporter substrate-binding protein [Hyphomicrobiaceae bacterium]
MQRRYLLSLWPAVVSAGLLLQVQPAAADRKPVRIVSLNLCADQLLVELVERERIAAVTHLAADLKDSAIWEKAKGLPVTRGSAEDVLRYGPDLVLAGPFGVAATVNLLRRLSMNVVEVPLASDLDGVRVAVRTVAAAVGEEARGEAMIAAFDRRLAAVAASPRASSPTAVVYQVGGAVLATGSLADAALTAAGFRNKAAEYRLTRAGQVPLELLAAAPPDLLILTSAADEYRTVVSDNLRHPVLAALRRQGTSVEVPWRLWLCGTPHIADAIQRLVEARNHLEARRQ